MVSARRGAGSLQDGRVPVSGPLPDPRESTILSGPLKGQSTLIEGRGMGTGPPASFLEKDLNLYLKMIRGDYAELEEQKLKFTGPPLKDSVIVITSESLGDGSEHLGKILMKFFLKSLITSAVKPKALVFMNSGIHLVTEESEVIGNLTVLQEQGLKVLVCGTSVDYHQVEEKVKVGQVVSMLAICTELLDATKVITF